MQSQGDAIEARVGLLPPALGAIPLVPGHRRPIGDYLR